MSISNELRSRHDYLLAEQSRRKQSMPQKMFAVFALVVSLIAIGVAAGFDTAWFIAPTVIGALALSLIGLNAVCFRLNLRQSKAALDNRAW